MGGTDVAPWVLAAVALLLLTEDPRLRRDPRVLPRCGDDGLWRGLGGFAIASNSSTSPKMVNGTNFPCSSESSLQEFREEKEG